jgi:hypothetical protein
MFPFITLSVFFPQLKSPPKLKQNKTMIAEREARRRQARYEARNGHTLGNFHTDELRRIKNERVQAKKQVERRQARERDTQPEPSLNEQEHDFQVLEFKQVDLEEERDLARRRELEHICTQLNTLNDMAQMSAHIFERSHEKQDLVENNMENSTARMETALHEIAAAEKMRGNISTAKATLGGVGTGALTGLVASGGGAVGTVGGAVGGGLLAGTIGSWLNYFSRAAVDNFGRVDPYIERSINTNTYWGITFGIMQSSGP